MASWSDWFKEAAKLRFPLEKVLPIDLPSDIERLYSSGLPVLERRILDGNKFDFGALTEFCDRHPLNWIRVYHKKDKDKRRSKFGINTEQAIAFLTNLEADLTQYNIQMFESPINRFGGNVLSDNNRTVVEIVEGPQDIVGKCLAPFYHGQITETGHLRFLEDSASAPLKRAAWNTLNYLKIARGEYMKGYFEFVVSDKNETFFLDYKTLFDS